MDTEQEGLKIIVSGLDNAGKTSILTALKRKFDFEKEIIALKPTIRVEYNSTSFLGNKVYFWDMGGQSIYREVYIKNPDAYFSNTDLIVYVIDIQDTDRFEETLNYLDTVLKYFHENEIKNVPLIVSFHKYDPQLRGTDYINEDINELREKITEKHPDFRILFQQTSIYDIISIVQLISYALSVFDKAFFELSTLLESYLEEFDCTSLILFDQNGIIISEYYKESIEPKLYIGLLENIKEHLYYLKRMVDENDINHNFFDIEDKYLSYLHKIDFKNFPYYISVVIDESKREVLLDRFPDLVDEISSVFKTIFE